MPFLRAFPSTLLIWIFFLDDLDQIIHPRYFCWWLTAHPSKKNTPMFLSPQKGSCGAVSNVICNWSKSIVDRKPLRMRRWESCGAGSWAVDRSLRIRLYVLRKSKKGISPNQSYDLGMGCWDHQSYDFREGSGFLWDTPPKFDIPEKLPSQYGKDRLETSIFQGRSVKLHGCILRKYNYMTMFILPSLKITAKAPETWMVGIWFISFCDELFSAANC